MIQLPNTDSSMIANNLQSFTPTHPGEILKEEIDYRGISQRQLAQAIGVAYSQLNEILNAKRPLTTDIALLVCQALDLDAEPLLKLQMEYNVRTTRENPTFIQRLRSIPRVASIALL
ncbi:MAG: HigA family addiction module antitoxin [Paludibacteraceae bacterium]|nr:HigA family addiction module antitoxin [Paludibacteraceae bacterium]